MRYHAFMSYSHAADGLLAPALQTALHRLARPWYRLRALRVFRDKTSLAANPGLWPSIEGALRESGQFVLMASPEAAASPWVQREVEWWLANRSSVMPLIVLTGGDLAWTERGTDFDWSRSTALGAYWRDRFAAEPLYVDLRWARTADDLSLRHSRFRTAVLDLAAALHGRAKDELDGEDVRRHRQAKALAWAAGLGLAILAITTSVAGLIALRQATIAESRRQDAERQRQLAQARQLAAQAQLLQSERTDSLPTAMLIGVESLRRAPSLEATQALQRGLQLLARGPLIAVHPHNVNAAVTVHAGAHLLTGSDDGTVRLWDAVTGKELRKAVAAARVMELRLDKAERFVATLGYEENVVALWDLPTLRERVRLEHPDAVEAIEISPDGTQAVSAAVDGFARLWDIPAGTPRLRFPHDLAVTRLAVDAGWQTLVTGSDDGSARIWDLRSGAEIFRVDQGARVGAVAVSADGRRIAVGGWNQRAEAYDVASRRRIATAAFGGVVTRCRFSRDGRLFAAASDDGTASMLDLKTGRELTRYRPEGGVLRMEFSPDDSRLVTTGLATVAQVWEIGQAREVARVVHGGFIMGLSISPDGKSLVTASRDKTARISSLASEVSAFPLSHGARFRAVAFSEGGQFLAHSSAADSVAVFDVRRGKRTFQVAGIDTVDLLAVSSDGRYLVSQGGDRRYIQAHDTTTGARLWRVESNRPRYPFRPALLSPDGRYVVAEEGQSRAMDILDTVTGRSVGRATHDAMPMNRRFSPDGRLLATAGGDDKSVRLWSVPGGQEAARLSHPAATLNVAFSPDGSKLASAAADGIRLWNVADRRQTMALDSRAGAIDAVFAMDGRQLAASFGAEVRIYDLLRGGPPRVLRHSGTVENLQFSPDGRHLATGCRDNSARIWEVGSGAEVARMTGMNESFSVAFDPDGRYLLAEYAAPDHVWQSWLWRTADLISEVCSRSTENLDGEVWKSYLGDEPYQPTCPSLPVPANEPSASAEDGD